MSAFRPKVDETYIYATQQDPALRIVVVIPEEIEAPEVLEFFYAANQRGELVTRPFVQDHAATVTARVAINHQIRDA